MTLAEITIPIAVFFGIFSLHALNSYKSSQKSVVSGIISIICCVFSSITFNSADQNQISHIMWIMCLILSGVIIGNKIANKISMEALPELMAAFHSLIGLSALITDICFSIMYHSYSNTNFVTTIELSVGILIGAITFSGSIIAFFKLKNSLTTFIAFCSKFLPNHKVNFFNVTVVQIIFTCIILMLQIESTNYKLIACYSPFLLYQTYLLLSKQSNFLIQKMYKISISLTVLFFILPICMMHIPLSSHNIETIIVVLSLLLGVTTIIFISGSDMAIAISVLNAYSGWAAVFVGITINQTILIIIGIVVAISGSMLSYVMCKSMNKPIVDVLFKFKTTSQNANEEKPIQIASPEDIAFAIQNASKVLIIPGYGMAASQAQHVLKNLTETLHKQSVEVVFGIHPVAGRMPGHMNVLLAEAHINYDCVEEIDTVNSDISTYEVALVVGANDTVNPSAKTDKNSPLYGMEIFDLSTVKQVFFIKRSMNAGYAGVQNALFYYSNTKMVFGEAKKICDEVLKIIS